MKKGEAGNQLSFISFFFLLVIVGVGIVGGVLSYYGGGDDYRKQASEGVGFLLETCLREEGINLSLTSCGFDETVVAREQLIISVCEGDCFASTPLVLLHTGDSVETCRITTNKNKAYPVCAERLVIIEDKAYHILVGTFNQGGGIS